MEEYRDNDIGLTAYQERCNLTNKKCGKTVVSKFLDHQLNTDGADHFFHGLPDNNYDGRKIW